MNGESVLPKQSIVLSEALVLIPIGIENNKNVRQMITIIIMKIVITKTVSNEIKHLKTLKYILILNKNLTPQYLDTPIYFLSKFIIK